MQKRSILLSAVNILALIAMITVNYLAVMLPLNGKTTGQLSKEYPNLFVPAGYTFSIWGVIYLLLILWCFYQLWYSLKKSKVSLLGQRLVGYWFLASCILNIAWIFSWHYELPTLALGIMILLLLTLIRIYKSLGIGIRETSHLERFFMHLPFSIYLGWISVATIANATAVLVSWNWFGIGMPEAAYSSLMIIVAGMLAFYFLNYNVDIFYTLVIIWAIMGIFFRFYHSENPQPIITTTCLFVVLPLIFKYLKLRKSNPSTRAYW
jgi:hypothetical protein